MIPDSFPTLLVAGEFPPNASGGGPAVLRQMLKDWPNQRLFWWSCFPDNDRRFGQQVAEHRVATLRRKFYPNRRWVALRSSLLDFIWVPRATRHLRKTLADLQPAAVWIVPHSWSIPPLAGALLNSPVRFHLTLQDYPEMNSSIAAFGRDRCRRWAQWVDTLYSDATTRDATSHPMIEDLKRRTGADASQMMHAALEPEDFAYLENRIAHPAAQIRIAHAGTIHAEPEFELLVRALRQVRLPAPVKIDLFGSHSYRSRPWFDSSWMEEHGNLPEEALRKALRDCTWGFAPMSLADDDPRYNHFSFPTKFIVYLAAGLPVITLGHSDNSVMKTSAAYRVGLRTTAPTAEQLAPALTDALSELAPWKIYGPEILRCGRAEFDASQKRSLLYQSLRYCAAETRPTRHASSV